jgi:hypothetical protein
MAGGAKMAAFAGECQQIFMPAVGTLNPGKTMVQITTVKVAVDHLFGIGAKKAIFFAKLLIVGLFKGFEVVFNALVILIYCKGSTSMIRTIVSISMNPSIDKSSSVERVIAERKLYCGKPRYEPGGGGVNVSRAIKKLGGNQSFFICKEDCPGNYSIIYWRKRK